MSRNWIVRIGLGLVVLAILISGGVLAFQAGVNVGLAQQLPDGQAMGPWMMYGGPRMGWGGPGFGFFGLGLGIFGFIFQVALVFLIVAGLGRLFFRGGWRGGPGGFEARARERFDEWHREAHAGDKPAEP
jgi:hypothetical protein